VITATRAEYGLLVPLLRAIDARKDLSLCLVVTGTHLSEAFGRTVDVIEADGFEIAARVDILRPGDDAQAAADIMAAALARLTAAFSDLKPDVLVLLGDRYETLAAASAAMLSGIPIAHIHGGELTAGAFDDAIRHAVTKLAHLHFTAAEPYRQRVVQMGEDPDNTYAVGALAADNLRTLDFLDRAELEADLGRRLEPPLFLATYHPVTLAGDDGLAGVQAVTAALERFPEASVVFTGVNADPGHESVNRVIREFVARNPARASLHASLGSLRYLSLMKIADAVVGNSSSGVIEAPILGTPTVNVGPRQAGRLRAATVFDCDGMPAAVAEALERAMGREADGGRKTPFFLGDGNAAGRMADILSAVDLASLRDKRFRDVAPALPPAPGPVTVIAEAGVNHNGSVETAKALIDAAAAAGADAVKFQSFKADALTTEAAPKAAYQARQTGAAQNQRDMLKTLELTEAGQRELLDHCRDRGVAFLSTPFDAASLAFLADELGLRTIKVGSGDLTNAPLLLGIAERGLKVILSTGMATMDEIEAALGVLAFGFSRSGGTPGRDAFRRAFLSPAGRAALKDRVTVLQCTTEYPAPLADVNLRAMDTIAARFGLPVGFSDHCEGSAAAIAAVARGARVIEKHITLDRTMAGPDHMASMEPGAFAAMVAAIRDVELALGDGVKRPLENEIANKAVARKSLVAARPIAKDEMFTVDNLTVKRPETGVPAYDYFDWLGRHASRDFDADEVIS